MTGCGEGTATDQRANTCRVEVRCVNNRFLKVSFRAREGFALLESRVESAVRERIRRGAVQVSIDVVGPVAPVSRSLDQSQLGAYLDQLEDFCDGHDLPVPNSIDGLLALLAGARHGFGNLLSLFLGGSLRLLDRLLGRLHRSSLRLHGGLGADAGSFRKGVGGSLLGGGRGSLGGLLNGDQGGDLKGLNLGSLNGRDGHAWIALLGGTSILLLFPTNCCGGFLFQFFLVRRGVQGHARRVGAHQENA
jgi:hypothetical protein